MEQSTSNLSQPAVRRKVTKRRQASCPTGYNLFCREISASEGIQVLPNKERFGLYATKWAMVTPEERQKYKERASSSVMSSEDRQRKWLKGVRKLMKEMNDLQSLLPTSGYFVVLPDNGAPQFGGTTEGRKFVASNYDAVVKEFVEDLQTHPTHEKQAVSVKDIRDLFNCKYSSALGMKKKLPYKKMTGIRMEGLPEGITLKDPARYGCGQLRELWKVRDRLECIIQESSPTSADAHV